MEIPAHFAETTIESKGEPGRLWLAGLPAVIGSCVEQWDLALDGPVWHGYMGVALPCHTADDQAVVLKVSWIDDETRWEPVALAAWDGRGAVRLLRRDDARGAMLLERLDGSKTAGDLEGLEAAVLLGETCRRLAVSAPPGCGLPRVRDRAARMLEELPATWERLGRPFARPVLDEALATCRDFGPEQPDTLLHGDLIFANVLNADREPWLAIDPLGLLGEPAYDAGKFLTNRWADHTAAGDVAASIRRRLAAFADAAQVEPERARRWSLTRLVADGLWACEYQVEAMPRVNAVIDALHD
ncbi:MAG: kinase [Catenulispora sp.]|nr:kinase [Catenulispora sp.]